LSGTYQNNNFIIGNEKRYFKIAVVLTAAFLYVKTAHSGDNIISSDKNKEKEDVKLWEKEKQRLSNMATAIYGKTITVDEAPKNILGCTSGKGKIYVAKEHKLFNGLSEEQIKTIRLGVCTHEVGHLIYTSFDGIDRIEETERRRCVTANIYPVPFVSILHEIINIVEDPAIETSMFEHVGGSAAKALDYTIKMTYFLSGDISDENPMIELLNAFIQFGDGGFVKGEFRSREAKKVFQENAALFYDAINDPDPESRIKKAYQIYDHSKPLWAEKEKQDLDKLLKELHDFLKKNKNSSPIAGPSGRGKHGGSMASPRNEVRKKALEEIRKQLPKEKGKEKHPEDAEKNSCCDNPGEEPDPETGSESDSSDSSVDKENDDGQEMDSKEIFENSEPGVLPEIPKECLREINKEVSTIKEHTGDSDVQQYEEAPEDLSNDILSEVICKKPRNGWTFSERNVPEHTDQSEAYAAMISPMLDGIHYCTKQLERIFDSEKEFREYTSTGKLCIKRMNSGKVTPMLFTKRRRIGEKRSIAVAILVDNSGSMGGIKIQRARETSAALSEIFKSLDIPVYVLGFNTICSSDSVQIHFVKWKNTEYERQNILFMSSGGGNFDSYAIRYMSKILAKRKETHKVMIVISDGLPSVAFCGKNGVRENAESISDARRSNQEVIGVGLGNIKKESFLEMYGENGFIYVKSPQDLFDSISEKFADIVKKW